MNRHTHIVIKKRERTAKEISCFDYLRKCSGNLIKSDRARNSGR